MEKINISAYQGHAFAYGNRVIVHVLEDRIRRLPLFS